MVRVVSPFVVAVMLLLLAFSAAAASLPAGGSEIGAAVAGLAAAQPRTAGVTEAVVGLVNLPSTSTADYFGLLVGFALLAAAGAFILTVRRRMS